MTREEAIKWLRLDIDMMKFDPSTGEDAYLNDDARHVIEAQEMAIDALKQPECEDAVSRADMLNELDGWLEGFDANGHKESFADMKLVRSSMSKLPSAQPEIIRCKDCRWYKKEIGWNCIEFMVCSLSPIHKPIRKTDDFCSRAERREE